MVVPYNDTNMGLGIFDVLAESSEYVWHRDKESREIEVISGEGWQFQVEDCLPWLLTKGMKFTIESGVYHRLLKGVDNLEIRIKEIT